MAGTIKLDLEVLFDPEARVAIVSNGSKCTLKYYRNSEAADRLIGLLTSSIKDSTNVYRFRTFAEFQNCLAL